MTERVWEHTCFASLTARWARFGIARESLWQSSKSKGAVERGGEGQPRRDLTPHGLTINQLVLTLTRLDWARRMAEDARKWAVEGLCDARSLPEALTERRFPLLLHHLEKLEQHRNWLLDTAEYVLREDEQMRLSERDAHWLEEVIRQKNRDEGDIRFCAIDLSWRRLVRFASSSAQSKGAC